MDFAEAFFIYISHPTTVLVRTSRPSLVPSLGSRVFFLSLCVVCVKKRSLCVPRECRRVVTVGAGATYMDTDHPRKSHAHMREERLAAGAGVG